MQFPVSVYFFCLAALFLVYIYIFFFTFMPWRRPPAFFRPKVFSIHKFSLLWSRQEERRRRLCQLDTPKTSRRPSKNFSCGENIVCCASRNFFSPRGEIIQRHILEWPTSAFARANSWLFAIRYYSLLPATGYGRLLFVFSQLAQSNNSLMFYKLLWQRPDVHDSLPSSVICRPINVGK